MLQIIGSLRETYYVKNTPFGILYMISREK